jgi:DNA-binding NarL/FixJ family response regulator
VTLRVLVADDQPLIRGGLVALLSAAPGFQPVGQASTGREAVELAASTAPDLILMDIRMPSMDGIEATRMIVSRAATDGDEPPRIVILTTFDLDEYVYAALAAGAAGFLLKDAPPERILAALELVAGGDLLLAPAVTRRLVETHARQWGATMRGTETLTSLTPREIDVLRLLGGGLSNADIASELVVSESTVKTHVKRLMSKLDLHSRAQGVVVAYETGLVVPSPTSTDVTGMSG